MCVCVCVCGCVRERERENQHAITRVPPRLGCQLLAILCLSLPIVVYLSVGRVRAVFSAKCVFVYVVVAARASIYAAAGRLL